jgi:hypothetical protein
MQMDTYHNDTLLQHLRQLFDHEFTKRRVCLNRRIVRRVTDRLHDVGPSVESPAANEGDASGFPLGLRLRARGRHLPPIDDRIVRGVQGARGRGVVHDFNWRRYGQLLDRDLPAIDALRRAECFKIVEVHFRRIHDDPRESEEFQQLDGCRTFKLVYLNN